MLLFSDLLRLIPICVRPETQARCPFGRKIVNVNVLVLMGLHAHFQEQSLLYHNQVIGEGIAL